jgi:hypothetical protein
MLHENSAERFGHEWTTLPRPRCEDRVVHANFMIADDMRTMRTAVRQRPTRQGCCSGAPTSGPGLRTGGRGPGRGIMLSR